MASSRKISLFMTLYLLVTLAFSATRALCLEKNDPAIKANASVIEDTLQQVSRLPAAEINAYADCYYTAIIDIHRIMSGKSMPIKMAGESRK